MPITHSSASQQGDEQTRRAVEIRIFEEIKDCTHQNVEGFFSKYFEGKDWTERTEEIYRAVRDRHVDNRWTDFPQPPVQNAVLEWLFRFQKEFLSDARSVYYTSESSKDLTGAEARRQLDIFVKRNGENISKTVHDWKDVEVIGELRESNNDWKAKLLQLGRYMRDVFATQPTRRFVHGFTLLGTTMELWVFDRSGPYSSGPFDIHEKPEHFIKAVAGYAMMSNEELGLDTFVERKVENGLITVTEDATGCRKKLWLEPDLMAYQRAIVCRGTSCFRAGILGTEDPRYVVKFSWTSDKRPPEADLLRLARERGVRGVAKLFGFHRITSIADIREGLTFIKSRTFRNATSSPSSSFSQSQSQILHQSFNQLHGLSIAGGSPRKRKSIDAGGKSSKRSRSNSQGPDRAKQGNEVAYAMEENQTPSLYAASLDPFDNRIFRCLVISPAGRAIDDFKSILELLEALRDAIKMVTGLFRCIRCENGSTALISVGLESPLSVNRVARHVMRIVANISTLPSDQWETEYEERDGRLCINRVMAANHLNRSIYPKTIERSNQQKFGYEDRALALRVGTTGLLDTLDFVQDTQGGQRMAPDEVEVKVKAVGVNFKDILTALGRLPEGELGLECAGIVTRACPGVKVVPGDRVCVTGLGTYRTYVRIAARHVHQIPDPMSFSEATALPVVYCAAYQALYECARIAPQESILIHSGASGTGQAAIQLSRLADAEIFVTVGSEDEKKLIMDLYAIPEDHIFASRGLSFKKGVKRMTKGRGVDIVLNSLSGERLQASWDCLAPFGRFIEIGKNDIIQGSKLSMLQFAENRTFTAIDLVHMLRERPTLIEKTMQAILTLAESGRIKSPQPLHIFSISNIEGAFRYLQGGTNTGKTIVEIDDDAMVPVSNYLDNHVFEAL